MEKTTPNNITHKTNFLYSNTAPAGRNAFNDTAIALEKQPYLLGIFHGLTVSWSPSNLNLLYEPPLNRTSTALDVNKEINPITTNRIHHGQNFNLNTLTNSFDRPYKDTIKYLIYTIDFMLINHNQHPYFKGLSKHTYLEIKKIKKNQSIANIFGFGQLKMNVEKVNQLIEIAIDACIQKENTFLYDDNLLLELIIRHSQSKNLFKEKYATHKESIFAIYNQSMQAVELSILIENATPDPFKEELSQIKSKAVALHTDTFRPTDENLHSFPIESLYSPLLPFAEKIRQIQHRIEAKNAINANNANIPSKNRKRKYSKGSL